jgi:hypothetical protein
MGPRLAEAITYRGAITDTDLADNHYRVVDGDRLLWSGRSTTWEGDAGRFATKLLADIAAIYPQLGEVEVEHAWSGLLGNPMHRMPQIGELSHGLWLASCFGVNGLNNTAIARKIDAQAIAKETMHGGCLRRSSWLGRAAIGARRDAGLLLVVQRGRRAGSGARTREFRRAEAAAARAKSSRDRGGPAPWCRQDSCRRSGAAQLPADPSLPARPCPRNRAHRGA